MNHPIWWDGREIQGKERITRSIGGDADFEHATRLTSKFIGDVSARSVKYGWEVLWAFVSTIRGIFNILYCLPDKRFCLVLPTNLFFLFHHD